MVKVRLQQQQQQKQAWYIQEVKEIRGVTENSANTEVGKIQSRRKGESHRDAFRPCSIYIYIYQYMERTPDESFKTKQPVGVYFILFYFIVHCFSSYLFYALIPFIEHFLKQRRFIY